jgi:hypothetical protein
MAGRKPPGHSERGPALMLGRQKGGAFLSYARKDGEPFAKALREKLQREAPDINIKQDRILLERGVGGWKQITDAIDSIDFLVLIMTPYARVARLQIHPKSGNCRKRPP